MEDYTFLTLAIEEARNPILKHLVYNRAKLKGSVRNERDADNMSKLRISTTLVVNNLPEKELQSAIVITTKNLFGEDNIVKVSFEHTSNHKARRAR